MSSQNQPNPNPDKPGFPGFEENLIAALLGFMVVITFVNVTLRYVFNHALIWGLETVLILFAWLVLFGIGFGFKITSHLGVDALLGYMSRANQRRLGLVSGAVCIVYAVLLLKGAYDYWAPFAGLMQTDGRWFPTGLVETRSRAFYETDQVPMLPIFNWLEGAINDGDAYEKLPRVVPYIILPVSMALMLWRLVQATMRVYRDEAVSLIVSHEAEDDVRDAAAQMAADDAADTSGASTPAPKA